MGLPILGKINNIYSITREMVVEYHQRNYFGENIIVIGAGDHKHEELVEMVAKRFAALPRLSPIKEQEDISLKRNAKPTFADEFTLFNYQNMNPESLNISYLQEGPSQVDPDYFAFLLIQRILGDKPESPLDNELTGCMISNNCHSLFNLVLSS